MPIVGIMGVLGIMTEVESEDRCKAQGESFESRFGSGSHLNLAPAEMTEMAAE